MTKVFHVEPTLWEQSTDGRVQGSSEQPDPRGGVTGAQIGSAGQRAGRCGSSSGTIASVIEGLSRTGAGASDEDRTGMFHVEHTKVRAPGRLQQCGVAGTNWLRPWTTAHRCRGSGGDHVVRT
jgi:hypothetical protein